jgi:hypothetical protein
VEGEYMSKKQLEKALKAERTENEVLRFVIENWKNGFYKRG